MTIGNIYLGQKQLIIEEDEMCKFYTLDLTYRYWNIITHKFYGRYHPQIITMMTLSTILPYLNAMPVELWSLIFSEF